MLRVLAIFLCASTLGACQASGQKPAYLAAGQFDEPVPAGNTRIRLAKWDRERWLANNGDTFTASRTVFQCRPLACPGATNVVFANTRSPTRKPDATALGRFAADRDDKLSNVGWTITSSRVTTLRGYPTLQREGRKEINGRMIYTSEDLMFVGSMAVDVTSNSEDANAARRYRDEFASALEIKDGGPVPQQ